MELRFIQSPGVSSIPRSNLIEKPFDYGQFIRSLKQKRHPHSRNLKLVHFKVQASGATKLGSQAVVQSSKDDNVKDENIVFVAGATGKVGSRTVRELLKLGFKVRAGVRSAQRAQPLVKSVQQMKLGETKAPAVDMLELVECDLEKKEQIGPALSNSSVVICCIGASEKEIFDVTGPFRIDYQATKNLIDAATVAKVKHFILLTSLGTNKVGFPAAILNLFWGVLLWKRKAEEALFASGIPYTIVRPGGMERPTDSYKETHNLTLSLEDTLFGGQVSNLQVAELLAFMAKNLDVSCCKVVEVIAETTAPLTPMGELLTKIPTQRPECLPKEPVIADKPEPVVADKPEPVSTSASSESSSSSPEKESIPSKPAPPRPSSPYFAYEDLKPPVSPTPKAPSGSKEVVNATEIKPEPTLVGFETSTSQATTAEAEPTAAEVKISSPLSLYIAYEDLKPPVSPTPKAPNGSKEVVNATDIKPESTLVGVETSTSQATTAEPESTAAEVNISSPLSPYTAYEDLKPPVSPSPKVPGGQEVNIVETVPEPTPAISEASLSSTTTYYYSYEDLKGVNIDETVPEPTPVISEASLGSTTITGTSEPEVAAIEVQKPSVLSPYAAYDELKPPTSPSPSSPSVSIPPTIPTANGGLSSAQTATNSRPLSPFAMYEDLKPPTSPTPSSP